MTTASPKLLEARDFLKSQDPDLSDAEVGIVGSLSHIATGTSYHLGGDQLKLAKNPYSARTARDRAGLADPAVANFASALDIDDDLDELRNMSVWIVGECRAGSSDTADIREVIYTPDGVTVWTWDRELGGGSAPQRRGDSSHLTHTHISWYRDAGLRDKAGIFRRYFFRDLEAGMFPVCKFGENTQMAAWIQFMLLRIDPGCLPRFGVNGVYNEEVAAALARLNIGTRDQGRKFEGQEATALICEVSRKMGAGQGPKGDKGDQGDPGKTPTQVTFGPVTAAVTASA